MCFCTAEPSLNSLAASSGGSLSTGCYLHRSRTCLSWLAPLHTSRSQTCHVWGLKRKVCLARVPFLRPSLAQVPAEKSVAQVMGWLRCTFGRQGIEVPEPLEVLLASCCLLHVPWGRAMKLCHAEEPGVVVDQLGMPVACHGSCVVHCHRTSEQLHLDASRQQLFPNINGKWQYATSLLLGYVA